MKFSKIKNLLDVLNFFSIDYTSIELELDIDIERYLKLQESGNFFWIVLLIN